MKRRRLLVLLGKMRRRRIVTKVRAGCEIGSGPPDELEGVGEAFSCSFEPVHKNMN